MGLVVDPRSKEAAAQVVGMNPHEVDVYTRHLETMAAGCTPLAGQDPPGQDVDPPGCSHRFEADDDQLGMPDGRGEADRVRPRRLCAVGLHALDGPTTSLDRAMKVEADLSRVAPSHILHMSPSS